MRIFVCLCCLVAFTFMGGASGFLVGLLQPRTFQSSCQLLVEMPRDADADPDEEIPSIEYLRKLFLSDPVTRKAFAHPRTGHFRDQFDGNIETFKEVSFQSLSISADSANGSRVVLSIQFEHPDPEACEMAVNAYADAFHKFAYERSSGSHHKLLECVARATENLHPKMLNLEKRYRAFRQNAPLQWNSEGDRVNPARERLVKLTEKRDVANEDLVQRQRTLAQVETASKDQDPVTALRVVAALLNLPADSVEAGQSEAEARRMLDVLILAKKAEVDGIIQQIDDLDQKIKAEESAAKNIREFELEDKAMRREIDRTSQLLKQLEVQMAKISLTEDSNTMEVTQLTEPTTAAPVGWDAGLTTTAGGIVGFLIGGILAVMAYVFWESPKQPDMLISSQFGKIPRVLEP